MDVDHSGIIDIVINQYQLHCSRHGRTVSQFYVTSVDEAKQSVRMCHEEKGEKTDNNEISG